MNASDTNSEPLLLDAKQAAQLLGVTVSRIKQLYRDGSLAGLRMAGTEENPRIIRFTRGAIEKFLQDVPVAQPRKAVAGA